MADYDDEFEGHSDGEEHAHPTVTVTAAPSSTGASNVGMSAVDSAIQAALDSGLWRKTFDPTSKKYYYFHALTKVTTWDLAKELGFGPAPVTNKFVGRDSSSIVSPVDEPITLTLPMRFRSNAVVEPIAPASAAATGNVDADRRSTTHSSDEESSYAADFKQKGVSAVEQREFQQLSKFNAFGSISSAADTNRGVSLDAGTKLEQADEDDVKNDSLGSEPAPRIDRHHRAANARDAFKAFASVDEHERSPEDPAKFKGDDHPFASFKAFGSERGSVDAPSLAPSKSPVVVPVKGEAVIPAKNSANFAKPQSEDSSSLFSTASQAVEQIRAAVVAPSKADCQVDSKVVATSQPSVAPVQVETAQRPTPVAANVVSPTLEFKPYVVPSKSDLAVNSLQLNGLSATATAPLHVYSSPLSTSSHPVTAATAAPVPLAPQLDSKILEIRETSEAVERLVRAFAHLRGFEPVDRNADTDLMYRARGGVAVVPSASMRRTNNNVGFVTSTTSDLRRRAELKSFEFGRKPSEYDVAVELKHEELLENAIVDCVLQMMMQDASTSRRTASTQINKNLPSPSKMSSYETVTVDQYRRFTTDYSSRGLRQAAQAGQTSSVDKLNPYRVFETTHEAFTSWRPQGSSSSLGDGELALGQLVEEALNKYVLKPMSLEALHAPLARLMLLDVLDVCTQAAVHRFGSFDHSLPSDAAGSPILILVRYDGPEKDLPLASRICHSLPFEAMNCGGDSNGSRVFRLEHWVTKAHLWTVISALHQSLRRAEVIAHDGYRVFSQQPPSSKAKKKPQPVPSDDNVFIPQERPMFVLLANDQFPTNHGEVSNDGRRARAPDRINAQCEDIMLPLAKVVSEIAIAAVDSPQLTSQPIVSSADLRSTVVDTIAELLVDADIRIAVERRVAAKALMMSEKQRDREGNHKQAQTAEEQEAQRRRQHLEMVQEAEARAARMIDEIRDELNQK